MISRWALSSNSKNSATRRGSKLAQLLLVCMACFVLPCREGQVRAETPPNDRSTTTGPVDEARESRRALLIGVSHYPNLGERYQLRGPANDVVLMRRLLRGIFGFSDSKIVTLAENEGAGDPSRVPTRANIEREMRNLADAVKSGDEVVIFLAGHGSQQPQTGAAGDRELDGLDEIFLPRDVGKWNGSLGQIVNTITDNQIADWLRAIRDANASVCLIVDACHSGTLLRAVDEQIRNVLPHAEDGLNIPEAEFRLAHREGSPAGGERARSLLAPSANGPSAYELARDGGVVALYACQPDEVTMERALPAGCQDAKHYGLLTFTLNKVLDEAAKLSTTPITYRELVRGVRTEYTRMGRRFPTPFAEGTDMDREVMGRKIWRGRSQITLLGGSRIDAGAIQGITPGSVLRVQAGVEAESKVLGHVEVFDVDALTAEVEPCPFEQTAANDNLPVGAVCRVVSIGLGDLAIKLAVDQRTVSGEELAESDRSRLAQQLRSLHGQGLTQFVENLSDADWLVRPADDTDQVFLVDAHQWTAKDPTRESSFFGPFVTDRALPEVVQSRLARIARAENLKRLAAQWSHTRVQTGSGLNLRVDLRRRPSRLDADRLEKVDDVRHGIVLSDGDQILLRVANPNRYPVDVNILYVDSQYGISALYPLEGEFNRLAPSESTEIQCTLNASTIGLEHVVIIGVRGSGQRLDLSALEQPGLEQAQRVMKDRSVGGVQWLKSPLGQLLQAALYDDQPLTSRGIQRETLDEHAMRLISWKILPKSDQ